MPSSFSNYGSVPVKAEYCHEAALRIVLHSLSTAAAKYGRYIRPQLSLSIDFYVRLFVRVSTGANEVKRAIRYVNLYIPDHDRAYQLITARRRCTTSV